MTLEDLGYNIELENFRKAQGLCSYDVGRVVSEHKERYMVKTAEKEYISEIVGNLRFSAKDRTDLPTVGDWVAISQYDNNNALIYAVFPRTTFLERQAVSKQGEKQIIAANIDFAFIVQAVDRDFNINRIERYLTICNAANVKPIIVLNKIDLIDGAVLSKLMEEIKERIDNVDVIPVSNESHEGIEKLRAIIRKGKTYCLLGSSGVGKSTLLNNLSGQQLMKTNTISVSTNKGRHVTSHRELTILENGGILIDNPGMREVGITDSSVGLEITFDKIIELSNACKYKDCSHSSEAGCAVIRAVENGKLDRHSYENYLRMEREKKHFELTVSEKRKKYREFGKMIKNFKKHNYKKY